MKSGGFCLLLILVSSVAFADRGGVEARQLNDRAAGAYALGRYAEAASLYEEAFAKKPIPELLYNAAQAHRFAGNNARALQLYENCLRVYAARLASHRDDIELHITELRFALMLRDEARAPSPAPVVADKRPVRPSPPPIVVAVAPEPLAITVEEREAPPASRKSRAWIWGVVVGTVAAAGLAVGLGVGLTRDPYPEVTLGWVKAQ
jgi:hypothetical protein